jgi:hypothetical protein
MDMFGGLTKTSSRIAIAAALGMTLGGFVMSSHPAKAADLGGDCCADLEERVAELEATTVRKGNKKVSVTISGWVVKLGSWWDDGHESNFYVGDKDTTLSSHIQISGSATIAPGWSAGYTLWLETPGNSASVGFNENQYNDNAQGVGPGGINTLDSFMWIKSDKWGTTNWGRLVQATNNLALLPDLSGTVIESNGVLFDGGGMLVRPNRAKNANDLGSDFTWNAVTNCISGGGGQGADCPTGLDGNGVRYDSPTWAGFSASGGYYEDDEWDIALKYAADWNNFKVSAAYGFAENTDEGCHTGVTSTGFLCAGGAESGGGGAPFQGFRKDVISNQVGASVMHVPTGLWIYGMWQNEQNEGTPIKQWNWNPNTFTFTTSDSAANDNNAWFIKAGIKRTWLPLGATVIWGEGGQYLDMFGGLCGTGSGTNQSPFQGNAVPCIGSMPAYIYPDGSAYNSATTINSSTVNRYGVGIVQEIDAAAMHVFFRWQHLDLSLNETCIDPYQCYAGTGNNYKAIGLGQKFNTSFDSLDIFQVGGVIFF